MNTTFHHIHTEILLMHECTCTGIHHQQTHTHQPPHRSGLGSGLGAPRASLTTCSVSFSSCSSEFCLVTSHSLREGKKQQEALKKPLKEYFPCSPFVRLSSTSPPPRCSTKPHKQMQMGVKTLHRERAGPPFERGAEWALKESLINLSTAPIGPLGIFFTPLSEWEGRGGGGGRRREEEGEVRGTK